jgi:hypothetical protein
MRLLIAPLSEQLDIILVTVLMQQLASGLAQPGRDMCWCLDAAAAAAAAHGRV